MTDVSEASTSQAESAPPIPGFWTMSWMFWMQPILLHQRLRASGIEDPDGRLIDMWRKNDQFSKTRRLYLQQLSGMLVVHTPTVAIVFQSALNLLGITVDYVGLAEGIVLGLIVGITVAVSLGVARGMALGSVVGLAFRVVFGEPDAVAFGVTFGLAAGAAGTASIGVAFGLTFGMMRGVAFSAACALTFGLVFGVARGPAFGVPCVMGTGLSMVLTIFRLPVFAIEASWSELIQQLSAIPSIVPLRLNSVLYHDLSYLRIPGLQNQMLASDVDEKLLRNALQACQRSPGQRGTGRITLAILKARELKHLFESQNFDGVSELSGTWLAGPTDQDFRVQRFSEIGRYLRAGSNAVVGRHQVQQVELARKKLADLKNTLLNDRTKEVVEFQLTLAVAESAADEFYRISQALAANELPNAFQAGDPLTANMGQETFRGREEAVLQIEVLLHDDQQAAAMALRAPRRCGKSSLLRMLPVKLPDALCVFFDLQDNPIASPLDLFPAVAKRTQEQARHQNRDPIPELNSNTLEAARDWLEALEHRPGHESVLLCLDEFERLEAIVSDKPETKQQLTQLMGLLRATIQHRRRVRILVSGSATFEELGPLWDDTFISAQEVRLGPLERETAVDLLRQPIPPEEGFPRNAIPLEVAEAIVDRTGGQPYLTQLYGFWLVEELNRQKRKQAERSDVSALDDIVCDKAGGFFRDAVRPRGATFEVRPIIEQIVAGKSPDLSGAEKRFLIRRGLLTDDGDLAFPILKYWLEEFAD